jgi:[glutamine synthetase] adenylyltransferase / [glutamine synthetase]-adenylyl-L-tyrosine phosphorylase
MKAEDLLLAPELSADKIHEFLRAYDFKAPAAVDQNLQLIAKEPQTRHILARMMNNVLEAARLAPDPDAAINYFERLTANVAHRSNFLRFLSETHEALEALLLICGTSPFNAEILIRNPEYFYWLLDQLGSPSTKSTERYLQEARQVMSTFERDTHQLQALARFKRRELLRIGARDLLKVSNVSSTMEELSSLADAVIQCVYEVCLCGLVARHGMPRHRDASGASRGADFTIMAMGKLGGQELNYSSDIDLIYIYSGEEGQTVAIEPSQTRVSNMEFFAKLAQAITRELSALTEEGYFYRVDLRLRPEGSAGPVATSLSACRNYYGSWGETFERLALIKARPVGGSAELGEEFCRTFNSFIYRKFLDFAALDEIQEIKGRIEAKLFSRKSHEQHVKLGAGGIREVEFFVQALQLIYGGRQPELQQRGTIRALAKLADLGYLQPAEHQTLAEAYLFVRDLEHKLQMVYHFQTHELPTDPEELYRCARRMGFKDKTEAATVDGFLKTLKQHRASVRRSFHDLVSRKRIGGANEQMREAALILNRNLNEAEALEVLSESGFNDPRTAFHQVRLLRDAQSFAHSPSKMRNLLANLLPPLLDTLRLSPDPDTGLNYFERFASSLGARDALYTLLNESPTALHRLLRVLSSSQFLADSLCRKPQLLDFLLRDEFLEDVKAMQDYLEDFRGELDATGDWRLQTQALREIQHLELFRIQLRDILEANDRPSVGAQLADLAEACLVATCEIACRQLEKQGNLGLTKWVTEHLVILSLGKLGGGDLSYNSDLDLVYFYSVNAEEEAADVQQRASCVVERIDEILSVSRGEGSIYKIDTRLKPEGKKGGIVTAIHRYEEYLRNRAAPWERLALVRHRFVFGSPENRSRLGQMIQAFVYGGPLSVQMLEEIRHIRQRMEAELGREQEENRFHIKAGRGGLTDIEFAVQLLQIRHRSRLGGLQVPNTLAALSELVQHGILAVPDYYTLYLGYEFLRFLENRLRIASSYGTATVSRTPQDLACISRLLDYSAAKDPRGAQDFEAAYLEITGRVREVFQRIVSELMQ